MAGPSSPQLSPLEIIHRLVSVVCVLIGADDFDVLLAEVPKPIVHSAGVRA